MVSRVRCALARRYHRFDRPFAAVWYTASMPADLASLERLLARTARRVRVQRGLEAACWALAVTATLAAVCIWLAPAARWTALAAAVVTVLAFVLAASRRVPGSLVSAAIDRVGALEGRVSAAHEFMRLAPPQRTPFVEAALRDAASASTPVLPAQAAPLHRPRAVWLALVASLLCVGVSARSLARAPHEQRPASSRSLSRAPLPRHIVRADELAVREENARAIEARTRTGAELRTSLADYRALLAELEAGTLSQAAALQRAVTIEAKLATSLRADDPADTATLRTLTAELNTATPELSRALARGELGRAAQALRALAEQLREKTLDVQQRARLSAALAEARERERQRAADAARERALESLLARQPEPSEPSLLKRHNEQKRELDKLRRKQAARPRRHLEKLSRELSRAADSLSRGETDEARDALDEAADALERYEGEQHDEEARRELARELAQLHELLQQEALSGQQERRAPQQFGRGDSREDKGQRDSSQAGERNQSGEPASPGDVDKARRERLQRFDLSARGRGDEPADGGTQRGLTAGSGAGTQQRLVLEQRPGRTITVDTPAESGGTEHDPRQLDAPTRSGGRYEDRALEGVSSQGPSRSQVIRSAAQTGFVSAPYRKVYGDYRTHEEAWLERDDVPAGYRFHVRRYFDLVRPRERQEGP